MTLRRLRELLAFARWYLRELTGESGYEHYCARRREHPDLPELTRREYERLRLDRRGADPGARCC